MSEHQTNMVIVGCIVRGGKIFVAKRAKTKKMFPDRYELVGGHVDVGEQPAQALFRETREEISLDVTVGQPVGAFTFTDDEGFKIEIAYLCYPLDDTEPTLNPADHSESRWIGQGEIDTFEKEDEETELLRQAFKLLEGEKS